MKQSGQGRPFNAGEPSPSLSRYVGSHVTSSAGGGMGHIYLTQSLSNLHPPFSSLPSQSSGSSPHGSRDYHPHHLQGMEISGGLSHRSHMVNPGLGLPSSHPQMHMTQHRRLSGHRVSLLRDIGIAGERERAESSGSVMPHSYSTGAPSHLMSSTFVYTTRPSISMLSSMSNVQASGMLVGSMPSQPGTPPRHSGGSSQMSRPPSSGSLHQYASPYLSSSGSIKSEPGVYGAYVKEEPGMSKSPMHMSSVPSHYAQLPQHHQFQSHQSQQRAPPAPSPKIDMQEKDEEAKPAKEHLLHAMDKVDKEITKVQSEMSRLERKKKELENAAKKPQQVEKPASPKKVEPKHRDLWQVIYAENKKKAEAAQGLLEHLGKHYPMPLYNQPRDTQVYKDNLKKNEEMRPKLLAYFQKKCQLSNIRERYMCARYDQLMTDWEKKADKVENNKNRKAKETKVREFFEKQFPEIRKQREQHERFSRSGTRGDACRSEADFNEIVDGLSEQEHHEQHMRQLAVVPPMLLDRDERRFKFINNNGLVSDPLEDYKKRQELDNWSPQEKQIFKEKYIQNPKNFLAISSCLEKKSVADCVLFYYLSKKSVGYKGLVRKNTLKPRKPKSGRAQQELGKTQADKLLDKDDPKKGLDVIMKEEEVERIERPPSPRMTRSRNKNLNWTDEDISIAKEGFGKHGKDFAAISRLFVNKTENQVKNFYVHYKKKHNLDQLISDGKKKKPSEGTRRTRTQVQTSESSTTAVEEEILAIDEGRPKSADPEIPIEVPEASKKRKKDSDADKKEEALKSEEKEAPSTTKSPSPTISTESESTPTSRGATPVGGASVSHIRTRRSVAAASTGPEGRSESAKRSSESSPVDEPAEKKAKKSKSAKDLKMDSKEALATTSTEKTIEPEVVAEKKEELEGEKIDEPPEVTTKEEVSTKPAEQVSLPTSTAPPVSKVEPSPSTVADSHPPDVIPSVAVSVPKTSAVHVSVPMKLTEPQSVVTMATEVRLVSVAPKDEVPPSKPKAENDGDSSATCSADEEPNMQDVETSKPIERKHADSPYAFEDDSAASIKLETSRTHVHTTAITTMSIQLPMQGVQPENIGRPSSTHAPLPPPMRTQDEKRPQSLPPPPGALPATSLPISAIRPPKQPQPGDSRPNSTPIFVPGMFPQWTSTVTGTPPVPPMPVPYGTLGMTHALLLPPGSLEGKHSIGKIPEPAEIMSALRTSVAMKYTTSSTAPKSVVGQSQAPQAPSKQVSQTIDLTKPTPSSVRAEKAPEKKPSVTTSSGARLPHYHPVSQSAASLQKDFAPQRMAMKSIEDISTETIVSRPHKYTSADIASMKDRHALIPSGPIPVSSLRFPMTSSLSSRDVIKSSPDYTIKKEMAPISGPERIFDPQHRADHGVMQRPGQHGVPPQVPAGFVRPSLTTSPIQTKFVSGTMMSGAPVLQKQTQKPSESLPMSFEAARLETKPPLSHPISYVKNPTAISNRPPTGPSDDRVRLIESTMKVIPASRASIVKGTPIPHEGAPSTIRAPPGLDSTRTNSPSPSLKTYTGPGAQAPKPMAGSITTGLPVHRVHESRPEQRPMVRTDIIPGREILVQAPRLVSPSPHERQTLEVSRHHDTKILHEVMPRHSAPPQHAFPRFPMPGMHSVVQHGMTIKSELMRGSPTAGSILAGTPVKRKTSEDSNPNVSPSGNPTAFSGVASSRHSPTVIQPSAKMPDRKLLRGPGQPTSENFWAHSQPPYQKYHGGPGGDKPKKDDRYHGARHTPDKVGREPMPSALSPGQRHTPTGLLAQHPMVKQEVPGSPRPGEDPMVMQRQPSALPHMLDPRMLAAAASNPEVMRMLALSNYPALGLSGAAAAAGMAGPGGLGMNPEMLEIWRQYGGAAGPGPGYPIYFPGLYPGLPRVMTPIGSPIAPGSPQADDGRERTKKLLSQDFLTAQQMQRNLPGITTAVTVPGAGPLGFPLVSHPMTTGITSHLVASSSAPYPLGVYPPGSLAVDRLNFIPQGPEIRSPFSPYVASGRNSSTRSPIPISPNESSRSPIQRTRVPSPEFIKQRHRSGEPRERDIPPHHIGRSSPASPYHSPRGTTSPRDRYTPQGISHHLQPSPIHPSQRTNPQAPKPYYYHLPSSTSPAQIPFHHMTASPHHLPPSHYPGAEALNALVETASKQPRAPDSRSSPFMGRHNRTGSLDTGRQSQSEKLRPDSAGPHPRSQPQSPHMPPTLESHKLVAYPHAMKQESRQSPKPQPDRKPYPGPPMARDSRETQKSSQEGLQFLGQPGQRESPRTTPRPTSKESGSRPQPSGRQPQPMPAIGMPPGLLPGQRQRTTSPYPPQPGMPPTGYEKEPGHPHAQPCGEPGQGSKEPLENQLPKSMSSNPAEDLKKSGRAKMTAGNFIDAIININYLNPKQTAEQHQLGLQRPVPNAKSPRPAQQVVPNPQPHQPRQSSAPPPPRVTEKPSMLTQAPMAKQEMGMQKPGRYEGEPKLGVSAAPGLAHPFAMMPFLPQHGLPTDPSKLDAGMSSHSSPANRTLSFAEHSADVINECYRKTTSDNSPSPVSVGSPRSNSGNVGMEPISPPEGRSGASGQVKKPQQQTVPPHQQQTFHPQMQPQIPRFPTQSLQAQPERTMTSSSPRPLTQIPQQRHPIPPQAMPQSAGMPLTQLNPAAAPPQHMSAAPGGGSLEDIIRKALMNGSPSTSPELRRPSEQPMGSMPHGSDLFITHAMMSSGMGMPMGMQVTQAMQQKPKMMPAEPRKEAAPTSQAQSEQMGGSTKYMSALMFRQMPSTGPPQGAGPASTQSQERPQQFYPGPAPRSTHTSSSGSAHSPATPSEPGQQRPQAPAMLPQYEALSDSD